MIMLAIFGTTGRNVVQDSVSAKTRPAAVNAQKRAESSQAFEAWLQDYRRRLEQLCQLRTDGLQLDREF